MKRKIICLLLALVMFTASTLSLSSCALLNGDSILDMIGGTSGGDTDKGGDTVINVEGGDSYDVSIYPEGEDDLLSASHALLSVVSVIAEFEEAPSGYGITDGETYYAAGAGVIYKLDKENGNAYVITNYHVVYDKESNTKNKISDKIYLTLYGQESSDYYIPATYVGGSMNYDIAVLEVKASTVLMESAAIEAKFADSDKIEVLETAIAIGNPKGHGISATVGHVNVDSEYIEMTGADERTEVSIRVIRTDAAVNGGNSGGGLFNSRGEVIGIVNAKIVDTSVENFGYAIPSNVARYIADNIIYYCLGTAKECVYRCILGISITVGEAHTAYDPETGKITKTQLPKVVEITAGSAAEGKFEINDIIVGMSIDGVEYEVTRQHHIIDNMLNVRPGSTVTFTVKNNGVSRFVTLTTTEDMLQAYK